MWTSLAKKYPVLRACKPVDLDRHRGNLPDRGGYGENPTATAMHQSALTSVGAEPFQRHARFAELSTMSADFKNVSIDTGVRIPIRLDAEGRMLCPCLSCGSQELMVETDEPGVFQCSYAKAAFDDARAALARYFATHTDEQILGL